MIQQTYEQNSKSWFLAISVIAFLMVGVLSGYFQVKTGALQKSIANLEAQKAEMEKSASDYAVQFKEKSSAEQLEGALTQIKAKELQWSRIMEKIENIIPQDGEKPIVLFRAINGGEDGKLLVNGITRADSPDPFADTAMTIRAFSGDPAFTNVFVPSITKNYTSEGAMELTFSMNLEYVKDFTK